MSLPHFFAGAPERGEAVTLRADDAHHAMRSLRLAPGDRFTSSDGRGGLAVCRIVRATHLLVEGDVEERTAEPRPEPRIAVMLAPPKGERLQWAVQKLTEIGVDRVVLLEAARSVRRWEAGRADRAIARLTAVAHEAAKQSRRRFLPEVAGPVAWTDALDAAVADGVAIVLWERAEEPLSSVLREAAGPVALFVGPEGGIPEEDAAGARERGAALAALGPAILRTETAAVVGATLALARFGRFG